MPPAPASNGCSQQTRPAPKWAAPIPPLPKNDNHCAEPLDVSDIAAREAKARAELEALRDEISVFEARFSAAMASFSHM